METQIDLDWIPGSAVFIDLNCSEPQLPQLFEKRITHLRVVEGIRSNDVVRAQYL